MEHIRRRCVEVVPQGKAMPRSKAAKERCALEVRAKTLKLLEMHAELAQEKQNEEEEKEEYKAKEEARVFERIQDIKSVQDNAAFSDATAFKMLACMQMPGLCFVSPPNPDNSL
jgi:hypothetical protein